MGRSDSSAAVRRRRLSLSTRGQRCALASLLLLVSLAASPASGAGTGEWISISGPSATSVNAIAVSPASSERIVVGTYSGFAVTTNGGASWTAVKTGYGTYALAFDPADPSVVYGAMGFALTRSTDGGATYRVVIDEPAYCLAIDPSSRSTFYAGTSSHLYKSTDRGLHWSALISGIGVRDVAIDPGSPNNIWALVDAGGLQRSTDGGVTWTSVAGTPAHPRAIAVHPSNSSIVVVAAYDGIYRTTDGAKTWNRVMNVNGAGGIKADEAAPGRFYAWGLGWVYPNLDPRGVAYSVDDGATWSPLGYGLPTTYGPTTRATAFAIDPNDHTRVYAGTGSEGVYTMSVGATDAPTLRITSPNGGEYWDAATRHPITWTTRGSIENVRIEYSTSPLVDGELVDPKLIVASTPNTGSYSFVLPQMNANCYVRVSDAEGTTSDVCDWAFYIRMCGFTTLDPPSSPSFGAGGGRGTIEVALNSSCHLDARSDDPWIAVSSVERSWGSPGSVTYSVAPNLDSSPRTGRLRVGSASFYVEQSAGNPTTEGVIFVPIVLDVHGFGSSHYTSELTLTNRSSRDAFVRLTYTGAPDLGGGSGSAGVTLTAGRQIIEPDALAYLRRLGVPIPPSGNRGGTLAVGVRGATSLSEVSATVRTTTAVANGRAGLAYAGIPVFKALTGPVYICGLRENETDRSNLALQNAGNASDGNVTLRVTVLWGDFHSFWPPQEDVVLPPGGFVQMSGILRRHSSTNGNGYVKVERVGGTAPWYAYGVVNDEANSDGSFVPPQPVTTAYVSGLTVPVVVEAGVYTTELVATNWSTEKQTLALAFVSDQIDLPDHTAWTSMDLEKGQQVILPNVLQYFRDQGADGIGPAGTNYVGALYVKTNDRKLSEVAIGARTWNPGGGGKYGLFYPATPKGGASVDSAWLYGLQQNATNRANLAILNTGESGDDDDVFAVDVYEGATGRLVHTESGLTVKAKRRVQVNAVLTKWAPGVADGYVHIRRTSGLNPFIAYAVINDGGAPQEGSDDGAYLPASD